MAGQWSVMPKVVQLASGEIMLAGGRPGVMVWVGGRNEGSKWRTLNIAAEHNAGLAPTSASLFEAQSLHPRRHQCRTAPTTSKCCSHPNCTDNGAWCQSTAYTSLMPVGGNAFVILYDRLANGLGGPPGQWGLYDEVFSMRFTLE